MRSTCHALLGAVSKARCSLRTCLLVKAGPFFLLTKGMLKCPLSDLGKKGIGKQKEERGKSKRT